MSQPTIRILIPYLIPHELASNDALLMSAALREIGYTVELWSEVIHPQYAPVAQPVQRMRKESLASRRDVLIYHHSTTWLPGEHLLTESKNRLILRYYGNPPKEAFVPYSSLHARACESSADSLRRILNMKEVTVLGVSPFVCEESTVAGATGCETLAPLHRTEELQRAPLDDAMMSRYSDCPNILLAGSIVPHRGHARAIRVLAEYRRHFQPDAKVIFAGRVPTGLDSYVRDLNYLADVLGVREGVQFTGALNASQMKALYKSSAAFLLSSEYEGFSVPLLEAMRMEVPIVAMAGTSVTGTLGYSNVLDEWNDFVFASHIARLVEESDLSKRSIDKGSRRYFSQFCPEVLGRSLDRIVKHWIS